MKLKDLKQGMVGKLRNKKSVTVLHSGYYFINGWMMFTLEEKYNEDLTHKDYKTLDIMEVSFGNEVVFRRNGSGWFVPEIGEDYFFIDEFGDICLYTNSQEKYNDKLFDTERVFKTREEAVKRLRQQQATLSVERWIAENDVEVDLYDTDTWKCYLNYNVTSKEFKIMPYSYYIYMPKQFILSSKEKGKQLIKEREKELKIMFGVEE